MEFRVMSKTEHNQYKINNQTYACYKCGLVMCEDTFSLPCPPWERQSEGGIPQSGNQLEAGVLKELYKIESLLMSPFFEWNIYTFKERSFKDRQDEARYKIQQLILKLEGQTKK